MHLNVYDSRVAPLLGKGLSEVTIAVDDPSLCSVVVEMLAGCLLRHVVVLKDSPTSWPLPQLFRTGGRKRASKALAHHLAWKNHWHPVEFSTCGDAAFVIRAEKTGSVASVVWQGSSVLMRIPEGNLHALMEATYEVARIIRDHVVRRDPIVNGEVVLGHPQWPFARGGHAGVTTQPDLTCRHILVVGCGSIGSEVVRLLHAQGAHFTLIDNGKVTIFNPIRQWFGSREIGRRKVHVLARRFPGRVKRAVSMKAGQATMARLEEILDGAVFDGALLGAGTHDHGVVSSALVKRGIPHVASCCYPRARFFENIVVDTQRNTPCLHCYRGSVFLDPPATPPMDDELAQAIYAPISDQERARLYVDLVAEPATRIETGRAAQVAAMLLAELVCGHPAPWMQRLLDEKTTCLVGGNTVEQFADGSHAYGIRHAGQVIRLGLEDMAAASPACVACGRSLHWTPPPAPPGDDAELALLA